MNTNFLNDIPILEDFEVSEEQLNFIKSAYCKYHNEKYGNLLVELFPEDIDW